jgi:hypothetical protein
VRWNLKEAVGKPPVRRTEITYKAGLRETSWHKAVKSDNYHFCRSNVNVADRWRERACTLCAEVSQAVSLAVVTTNCEKSAEAIVAKKFL